MNGAATGPHRVSRVLVVGPVGAGKSTVAAQLERCGAMPRTDLDDVVLGTEWSRLPDDIARARIAELARGEAWIIDGNYAVGRDLLWRRADLVLWLDLPRRVTLVRLVRRTLRRLVRRHRMTHGNRESWRRLLSTNSILVWGWRSHAPLRAEYERAIEVYGERTTVERLRTPGEVRQWLAAVRPGAADSEGAATIEIPASRRVR